jgi:hypothetical protein
LTVSFFEYIGGDTPGYPPPKRVYAWVDALPAATGESLTRLDCVDADWADDQPRTLSLCEPKFSPDVERRVSMMLWRERTTQSQGKRTLEMLWLYLSSQQREGRIVEMRLRDAEPEEQPDVLHYLNLWAQPIPRVVQAVDWPKPRSEQAKRIAALTEMGPHDASEQEIRDVLKHVADKVDAVAVYDVGQGSCSALVADGVAQLYFDVGGGALADAKTFPTQFTGICTTARPPIVLSHWHFDHWSLVKRFAEQGPSGELLARKWIVPRQKQMRPTAATLLGLIRSNGGALIRPAGAPTIRVGAISLHSCIGRNMNDSGVAMVVHGRNGAAILLPGDARYKHIVDYPRHVTSLVAAHHGGHTGATASEIPLPDGQATGRVVFSCGFENSYHHPLERSLSAHGKAWPGVPPMLSSERGESQEPKHIHLYWDESQPSVAVGCGGGQCSLAASRR